ncbi:unnamed protein product [Parascedosporium putredinis]|uniref:Acyl-CoA thioesterase-like N-terminal HotDog domain-containing protein n=1 Tax=Parascedosporium putredinis TaxID=1442378 RepID=A0A9P1H2C4_9PEZI|nr:unnamed protein product [Parascedosporium putredinis]CAI7993489.1 unnamed protein product [Parascedosporium putredinis]
MTSESLEIVPFAEATRLNVVDSHVYAANLVEGYCIGSVPNGGYVASCILRAASEYLAARGQPDVISAHFEYVNRTEVGPAYLIIQDIKLGRALSTIQITLFQHDLQTSAPWMVKGEDAHWAPRPKSPSPRTNSYARAQLNVEIFSPRKGQPRRGVEESWIRLTSGEGFTNASLGFVADVFPTSAKRVQNGRFDLDVVIMDKHGDIVALSTHIRINMAQKFDSTSVVAAEDTEKAVSLSEDFVTDNEPDSATLPYVDDPRNPWNWSIWSRAFHTFIPAYLALLISLGSQVALRHHHHSFLGFLGGAAGAQNVETLLACRFLAGILGSPAVAICGGSVADLWEVQKGGSLVSITFILTAFLGPTLGPLIGTHVLYHHDDDWRWTQYILLMIGAPAWLGCLVMKETSQKWITRHDQGSGSTRITFSQLTTLMTRAIIKPTRMLCTEVVVFFLAIYSAFAYAMIFSCFASATYVLRRLYDFNSREASLSFLSIAIGGEEKSKDGLAAPEHHLYSGMVGNVLLSAGLFWNAWAPKDGGNWAVLVAAGLPIGLGAMGIFKRQFGVCNTS